MAISCPSCPTCLFIDWCCVIDNTPLNKTLGEANVKVALELAQEQILGSYSLIGEKCYVEICEALAADTLTDQQTEIIEQSKKLLSWHAYVNWLTLFGSGQNMQEGRKSDQQGQLQQIDSDQLQADILTAQSIAEVYERRFRNWLECQELECDRCEDTCTSCNECNKCTSSCGCLNTCLCINPILPTRRDTLRDTGTPNKILPYDDWAAI